MNQIINDGRVESMISTVSYNDAKRISDGAQAEIFYKECCNRLLEVNNWQRPIYLSYINKITHLDKYGYETNNFVRAADTIKIVFQNKLMQPNTMWLKIKEVVQDGDQDGYEKSLSLVLNEITDPNFTDYGIKLKVNNSCEMVLKKLINTISMSIKIKPIDSIDFDSKKDKSIIEDFDWPTLMKNTLLKI